MVSWIRHSFHIMFISAPCSETCIKGHRSTVCKHTDRPLFEDRPVTQCKHCRELCKTKQAHVKCICELKEDSPWGLFSGAIKQGVSDHTCMLTHASRRFQSCPMRARIRHWHDRLWPHPHLLLRCWTSANAVGPSLPPLSVPSTPQSMTNSGSRISSGCTWVVMEFIMLGRMWIRRSSMIFVKDHRWGAEEHDDHDKGRKRGQSTMTC